MHQLRMSDICDRTCKINHLSAKRWLIYITFALSQLNDHFYYRNKVFIDTAEFNEGYQSNRCNYVIMFSCLTD